MPSHEIERRKLELKRRTLTVTATHPVTPHLLRVYFTSEDLRDFTSPSPDDHIKIFLPQSNGETLGRDFTPRAYNNGAATLELEFALHECGPASDWARAAKPGDTLEIGGPRGTTVVPDDFDWYILIGDAAALPSFARRLEGLRPGVPVAAFLLVEAEEDQVTFTTSSALQAHWVASEAALLAALRDYRFPSGDGFIWIATETSLSRSLYQHVTSERKHPADWVKASGYWIRES